MPFRSAGGRGEWAERVIAVGGLSGLVGVARAKKKPNRMVGLFGLPGKNRKSMVPLPPLKVALGALFEARAGTPANLMATNRARHATCSTGKAVLVPVN